MKNVYFVTEGVTDQILLEALVAAWLGDEDFMPRHIQPPSSAYAEGLENRLSEGWKGVVSWCSVFRTQHHVTRFCEPPTA